AARADPTDSHHPEQRRQTVFKWAHCVITGVMEARSVFCTERNKSGFDVRLCDNRKLRCAHGRSNGERVAECGEAVIPGWEFVIQLMRSSRCTLLFEVDFAGFAKYQAVVRWNCP